MARTFSVHTRERHAPYMVVCKYRFSLLQINLEEEVLGFIAVFLAGGASFFLVRGAEDVEVGPLVG